MIVIGVSKAYENPSKRMHKKRPTSSKPKWKLYYKEDQSDKLRTRWISLVQVPFYKAQIRRLRLLICVDCKREFKAYVKNDKEIVDCPHCDI